ncbi:MAG TPA: hypothetical protein VLM79_39580 [Kofleriaceae bacterium]|nr:hypothetical protein [Kofleriaceae bacterium]
MPRKHNILTVLLLSAAPAAASPDAHAPPPDAKVAWRKLARLRDPEAFRAGSSRSRATKHRRRAPVAAGRRRRRSRDRTAAALRAIRELPETYRETMILRLVEGICPDCFRKP